MSNVIHPGDTTTIRDGDCYTIVAWNHNLPAFDPVPTIKTVLLSPSGVKKFNYLASSISRFTGPAVISAIILRLVSFALPAPIGRILAPLVAALQLPGMVLFTAGMRVEYVKIITRTFDFWFLQVANTIWAITFSAVLNDTRVVLVVISWVNFTNALLQETYLRNNFFIVGVALLEWLFFVMLLAILSLDLVDELHHRRLVSTGSHSLSTKDVLANVIGTMTMLSLRNLYRRYGNAKHYSSRTGSTTLALGYRSKIALCVTRASGILTQASALALVPATRKRPLLQMRLATETTRFYPQDTVWPLVGALTPLSSCQIGAIYALGAIGGSFSCVSYLSRSQSNILSTWISTVGLVTSSLFSGVFICCCQRQLLKRVVTSFHFMFLMLQMAAACLCDFDIFYWRWVPACSISSCSILAFTVLSIDALTPRMKQRLRFKLWVPITAIVVYSVVHTLLVVEIMILDNADLQDRVFLDFAILDKTSQFRVAPFLLSRLVTIFVWSGRYVYVALARKDDNAFILLRGDVEFDYESWKRQTKTLK